MAIAILVSVTVSMAAVNTGVLSVMFFERRVETSISLGSTSLSAGISKTSSKVRPSFANFSSVAILILPPIIVSVIITSNTIIVQYLILKKHPQRVRVFL